MLEPALADSGGFAVGQEQDLHFQPLVFGSGSFACEVGIARHSCLECYSLARLIHQLLEISCPLPADLEIDRGLLETAHLWLACRSFVVLDQLASAVELERLRSVHSELEQQTFGDCIPLSLGHGSRKLEDQRFSRPFVASAVPSRFRGSAAYLHWVSSSPSRLRVG